MSTPHSRVRAAGSALLSAAALALTLSASAEAKTIPTELRVVDSSGKVLAQQTQYTGPVEIKTDPKADCFGPDTGGSGDRVGLTDSNALGLLAHGATADRDLKPLSVTDAFDFGLGLCGIGKAISPQTGFWYLKQNHVASQVGGDQTIVKKGDEILWFLIEDFEDPVPDELALSAPATAEAGDEITVEVVSYGDDGKAKPAKGATVTGAAEETDAKGLTTVTLDEPLTSLSATREGAIPSNEEVICTAAAKQCPAGYAKTIGGTKGGDKIVGGKDAETIVAGGGDDKIDASKGSARDAIDCGGGKDKLTLSRSQKPTTSSCERIVRS